MLTLVRRPLLLMLVLGCAVSRIASGRLTIRLVADGALSFAFVPLCELAGFALVYRFRRPAVPFAEAADRFLTRNTPWLWWTLAIITAAVVLPAHRHGEIAAPLLMTALIVFVWSVFSDARFFRDVMGRSRRPRANRCRCPVHRRVVGGDGVLPRHGDHLSRFPLPVRRDGGGDLD